MCLPVYDFIQYCAGSTVDNCSTDAQRAYTPYIVCNVTYHMLEMLLAVACSVLRQSSYLVNRLLNTVPSSFLDISDMVCL